MENTKVLGIVAVVSVVMTVLCYGVGMFVIADFLPPPSPQLSEDMVLNLYRQNQLSIIAGLTLAFVGAGFMLPLYLMASVFMAQTEKGFPYFSVLQALCALATVLFAAIPNLVWMAAAYNLERSPELTYMLHQLGWIMWATPSWSFALQMLCLAICGLRDQRPVPFIPRWLSYLAIWVAIGVMPTPLVPFFVSGPFAWDGLFSFWLAFFSPIIWCSLLVLYILQSLWRSMSFRKQRNV